MSENTENAQERYIKYSRDVLHPYSKGVQKILNLELNYIGDCEKRYQDGENVIYASGMQDSPLVYACGAIPLATSEISRLGSHGGIELAEDYFQIPRDVCNMAKVLLAEFYLRKDKTVKRILSATRRCEPINSVYQFLNEFGYDVYSMDYGYRYDDLSNERYETYINFVTSEYQKAAKWISGKELDEKKLLLEMKRYNRVVKKARLIMNLRLHHNTYIRSLATMFVLMGIGHMFGRPEEYEEALDQILEEMTLLKPGEYHDEKLVPIVWTGARGMEFGVYESVDKAGGFVASFCLANCYTREFDEKLPPMESFIKFQVGGRFSGTAKTITRELEKAIADVGGRGIVSYGFNGCSFSGIASELYREYFQKRNVPLIRVDGSYQVGEPSGQLITRISAFMEMLA